MGTHNCIQITGVDSDPVMIHTSTDGQFDPDVLLAAVEIVAKRIRLVFDPSIIEPLTRQEVEKILTRNPNYLNWFEHPPCVAALIIAAVPMRYAPVVESDRKWLPQWSGIDKPSTLEIKGHSSWLYNHWEMKLELDPKLALLSSFPNAATAVESQSDGQS